jgi:predicted RND superfamily exporter protein
MTGGPAMTAGERIVDVVLRARWAWLLAVLALTAVAGAAAARVGVDNAVDIWFVEDDPALVAYRDFQETFGNDEVVVTAVFEADGGVFTPDGLARVRRVADAARATDGVAGARSIVDATGARGGPGVLDIGPAVDGWPVGPDAAAAAREAITSDPLLSRMVAGGGDASLVFAEMAAMDDIDQRRDGVLADYRARVVETGADVAHAGIGVIYAALNEASTKGAAGVMAAAYLVILLLLWRGLGRVGATGLTLGVVGVGAVWLLGAYGFVGRDINMVTMVMPTLVLVIGVSDCVHMLSHVAAQDPTLPRWERVRRGVGFVLWPCLLNTVTTAVGFLALGTSAMPVVRDLGIFCALGLFGAFFASLVLCAVVPTFSVRFEPKHDAAPLVQRAVDAAAELAIRRPGPVLLGAAFVGLLSALATTRIVADTYSIDYLADDHPARVDSDRIEATYGPYTPLEFVVARDAGVQDVATLTAIAAWQDALAAQEGVGFTRSGADVVRRLNEVLAADAAFAVPADPAALEQLFLLYRSDPDGTDLDAYFSRDGTQARVTVGIPMDSARGFGAAIDAAVALADLPPDATVRAAGYLPLYVRMMDYIVQSQLTSFGLAFVLIFGLIGVLFRSVRLAALAVPANLLPVLLTLGIMGVLGIRLDVATVTIAAIVLGLVVDDTIQFLYRYRHEARSTADVGEAVRRTVRGVGRPMALTSLVLGLGFSVLAFAAIKSVAWFGLLLAASLFSALVCDVLVLPAFLVLLNGAGQLRSVDAAA